MKWFSPDIVLVPEVKELEGLIDKINSQDSTYPFRITSGTNLKALQCFDVSKFNFHFNGATRISDNKRYVLFINVQASSGGFLALPFGNSLFLFGVIWSKEEGSNFYTLSFSNNVLRNHLASGVFADYPWPNPTEVVYVNPFASLSIQDTSIGLEKNNYSNKILIKTNNFSSKSIKVLGNIITARSVKGGL